MKNQIGYLLTGLLSVGLGLSCTKPFQNDNSASTKGLVDDLENVHVFATKYEDVDFLDTAEKEEATFLCFYKAPYLNGITDYTKAELLAGIKNPLIYQRYLSAMRREMLNMRIAGLTAASVGAVAGGMLSLALWREQPVAMALAAQGAKWAGGVFLARTGINKMTGAGPDAQSARAELLVASPFLIANLMPVFALPVAALVNGLSKEKALNELISDGVFKETTVNPGQDLGNSPYMHLRLTASAYEASVLKISADPKNVVQNVECTPKLTD